MKANSRLMATQFWFIFSSVILSNQYYLLTFAETEFTIRCNGIMVKIKILRNFHNEEFRVIFRKYSLFQNIFLYFDKKELKISESSFKNFFEKILKKIFSKFFQTSLIF